MIVEGYDSNDDPLSPSITRKARLIIKKNYANIALITWATITIIYVGVYLP